MAYLENQTPVSAAEALYLFKYAMTRRTDGVTNWSIPTSANGTVYAQSGDVITSAASLTTSGAWFVARGVAYLDTGIYYTTELCIQHNGVGGLRVKVSFRDGFTGGTPSPTQTPSAADEQYIPNLGGGTDASPTYGAFIPAPGYRMQGWFSEENETQFVLWYPVSGGACAALWMIDRPLPNPQGSGGNLLDKERITFYARTGSTCALAADVARDDRGPMSMFAYDEAVQLWGRCPAQMEWCYDSSGVPVKTMPGGCAASTIYSEPVVPEFPLVYRRRAALAGTTLTGEVGDVNTVDDKGASIYFRFAGQLAATPTLLDSVDPSTGCVTTGATLALGDLLFPWSGTALVL